MVCNLLGIQKVDYLSKKTEKRVQGLNLYVSYAADGVVGEMAESVYVSKSSSFYQLAQSFAPADHLRIEFNSRGYLQGIELLAP